MAQGRKTRKFFLNRKKRNRILFVFQLDSIQNGMPYTGNVSAETNSSTLPLKGSVDESGTYTCHWNNSLGEARFKRFIVTHVDKMEKIVDTIVIDVSVPLAILLLISIIVAVRFYILKVK